MPEKSIYKIVFTHEGQVWEIYAKEISQSSMFGFVEVEELLFGEKSSIVVDPTEEKLQIEFAGVDRTYIPLHAILRIDSVKRKGMPRITPGSEDGSKAKSKSKISTLSHIDFTPPEKRRR
ncbi:MAG: hypothetical protein ACI8TX_001492 [Hyphomicrobiaceae bacterium]|jgi:hypothetical protein